MTYSRKFAAALALIAFVTFSFTEVEEVKKEINTDKSKVTWKGYKVTGSHYGTVDIKSGELTFKGEELLGGYFVIDMTSIESHDLEGEYKGKLEGHLKSDDFFGVEKFPTAKLVFTNVEAAGKNAYKITADLTVKGKTESVTFDLSVYGSKATANLKVDRSKFDVRYGSATFFDDLKDKTIYDEFDLVTDLEF